MKTLIATLTLSLLTANSAFAYTYYYQNKSPSYFRNYAATIHQQQLYTTQNSLHPYSMLQSPYNNNSFRNNFNRYGAQIVTYDGKYQGHITQQVSSQNSATNPYGKHGSAFNPNSAAVPFNSQKWSHPNSIFQSPYNNNSVRYNPKYEIQYQDSHGHVIGTTDNNPNPYGVTGTFNHSPFAPGNVHNPYGGNKVFN